MREEILPGRNPAAGGEDSGQAALSIEVRRLLELLAEIVTNEALRAGGTDCAGDDVEVGK